MENNDKDNDKDLSIIKNELKDIKDTLSVLIKTIETLTTTCSRMDDHINFVENTYSTLKAPLDYMKIKVDGLIGTKKLN
jgi:hypothetical protein